MRFLVLSLLLLVVLVSCGYPVPEPTYPTAPPTYQTSPSYPLPKKYPVAPSYPVKPEYVQKPSYSAPPPPPPPNPSGYSSSSGTETVGSYSPASNTLAGGSAIDYNSVTSGSFRGKAKARTSHNRQFQRRALQPIRRFQQKQ